ncbi:MAG: phenylacetate--CoA ligase family protein [Gemmataceae bacterium]
MLPRGFLRAFVFPAAECLTRTRFWSYYQATRRFQSRDDAARDAVRAGNLARVWAAARETALNAQRMRDAGLPDGPPRPDEAFARLAALAPITKAAFRRAFPDGATRGGASADWRFQSTAGTTDRMTVVADFRKRDHVRASELHALNLALGREVGFPTVEIPPNACNVVCGLIDTGPPSLLGYLWQAARGGRLFTAEAQTELRGRFERQMVHRLHTLPPLDPMPAARLTDVLDRYLARIAALRPGHLRGFPVYLLWLADRLRDRGLPPPHGLAAVGPYGGLTSPAMAARIAGGFGCRFVQKYGTSELGVVAASCGRSPGMHVFEDFFHVEVLRRGVPAAAGAVGQLAVTDLINTAMPLLRYQVGDVGRLDPAPCPCGRRTARLEVLGRVQEVLPTADGVLTASDVADLAFGDPSVGNFRLEEVAPRSFEIAAVAVPGRDAPDVEGLRERFAAAHGGVQRVKVRLVPFVQPESSGKYRFVFARPGGEAI